MSARLRMLAIACCGVSIALTMPPASAQSVEFAVRARAAEQLRRAADLVDRGLSPEPVDLEVSLAAWEREALGAAANDRVRLVRGLVEQMQLQCKFGH